ncbi:unknown [Lachnospiraceae bacterium CAG:215]|nr:unknown [Lachnospiraceae bacterium CAG:215]
MKSKTQEQITYNMKQVKNKDSKIEIEQNRCAMACQGCGIAIFCFL